MPAKRAYSAYLSSTPADVPVVTANGAGAPQLQTQHPTPSSIDYLHVPGGWPQDYAVDAEQVTPPRASLFSTLGKWAATVSVVSLLSIPARLANRYLRRQTIKAIPIISSVGSSKKRFIAAGVADDEYATPSPSMRARANQTRRESQRQARQFRDPRIRHTSSAYTQDYDLAITPTLRYSDDADTSLDAKFDNSGDANTSLDVNVDFSFDSILTSTPGRNYHTGSPINAFWDSPQVGSPTSPTPSLQSYDHVYESPACDNAAPAWLFSQSPVNAAPDPTPSAQGSANSLLKSSRNGHRAFKIPTVTPMRRQLLKVQLGNDIKRRQAALPTEPAEQGSTETQSNQTNPEAANGDPSTTDDLSYASPLDKPHTHSLYNSPSESDGSPMQLDSVPAPTEFEYENDLSFLLDAPTPRRRKGVRWEKSAKCKAFYFDERVSEMLDSTLETINSSPIRNYYDVFQNTDRGASDGSEAASTPGSSAPSSPKITLLDSPAKDGGWRGVSIDAFNAPDESLEESQLSLELFEDLQREMQRKLALAPPPPPPPKPLVAPLTPGEEEILQGAAAKTNHGRNASQWVIEQKLYARDFATLLPRDFNGDPRAWLNDNIVNEYLSILVAAKKKEVGFAHKRNGPAPPLHAFSSFWYQTSDTSRWTNRFQLKGKQYLDAELILYPICDKGHWRLLAVYPRERSIEYFDSMGLDGQKYIDRLVEYLKQELGEHWIPEEWSKETAQRSGQQLNGSDCGVFTLMNALALIRGDAPDRVVATNGMDDARRRIAATLLAGQPTTELE
ncbi:hypothetical protein ACET3X_002637 [Alternaria dauci]|uniref:Ubiquitin-like protease family profile domain-containing protein n=1 Tax=Alternaria dauci TaxID=48095 RepID=A0ABR3UQ37_9PLEO